MSLYPHISTRFPYAAVACLYIKKLADVDQQTLQALIVKSLAAKRAS